MKKLVLLLLALISVTAPAWAKQKFKTEDEAVITEAKRWQQGMEAKPLLSDDGKVLYPYGQYMPTLVCSTMHACDIELEAGEQVVDKPRAGDTARWEIGKMESGPADKVTIHVVVKPRYSGEYETNLIIPTDRRVYHILLKSAKNESDYVNRMGFYYPEEMVTTWGRDAKKVADAAAAKKAETVTDLPGTNIDDLDFGYSIKGDAAFRPARVFTNGRKTFIQLPAVVRYQEMPTLVVLDENDKPILVNSRVEPPKCGEQCPDQGDTIEVDQMVRSAMLVLESDDKQTKVRITKDGYKAKTSWWPF